MAAVPSMLLFALLNNMEPGDLVQEGLEARGGALAPARDLMSGYDGSPLNDRVLSQLLQEPELREMLNEETLRLAELRLGVETAGGAGGEEPSLFELLITALSKDRELQEEREEEEEGSKRNDEVVKQSRRCYWSLVSCYKRKRRFVPSK